jgi:hypothetical protein
MACPRNTCRLRLELASHALRAQSAQTDEERQSVIDEGNLLRRDCAKFDYANEVLEGIESYIDKTQAL